MSRAGDFASSRRGGLTHDEIQEIIAHRAKDRPTPWQALSIRYGRPVATLQAAYDDAQKNTVALPIAFAPGDPADDSFWTPPVIRKLELLHGMAAAPSDIAKVIGSTRNAVIGKLARLGLINEKQGAAHV